MKCFVRALALWGLADAIFLAARPNDWARFWTKFCDVGVRWISSGKETPKVFAGLQFAFCLWLLKNMKD